MFTINQINPSKLNLKKFFIKADELEKDSWEFSKQLHQAGHQFDWVVGLTRGGVQISIYIQEALRNTLHLCNRN